MQSFVKIKSLQNGEIILSFTDIGKSCHSGDFISTQIFLFFENKILAKISELNDTGHKFSEFDVFFPFFSEFDSIKPNIMRILNIWEERKIYDRKYVKELKAILENGRLTDVSEPHPECYSKVI